MRAAREAIGPTAELFVDANGAYDRKQALAMAETFAHEYGVSWFEEPVSSDDLEGLRLLRDRAPAGMDITAGEYGYDLYYFRRMLEAGAVDVLQPDATRCGGVTGFMHAAALCRAYGMPLSAHTAPSIHAHLCCAALTARHIEYFHDHVRIEAMLFEGAQAPRARRAPPRPRRAPGSASSSRSSRPPASRSEPRPRKRHAPAYRTRQLLERGEHRAGEGPAPAGRRRSPVRCRLARDLLHGRLELPAPADRRRDPEAAIEALVETVAVCREHGAPIVNRGGGTSLAGQTCNTAVVIDGSKYLNQILQMDYERPRGAGAAGRDLRDRAPSRPSSTA